MSPLSLIIALLALSIFGYYFGRRRALALAGGRSHSLHSRPGYYGAYVALWCALPALGIFVLWLLAQPSVIESIVVSALPEAMRSLGPDRMSLLLNDIRNAADGTIPASRAAPHVAEAAAHLNRLDATGNGALAVIALALALAGLAFARGRVAPALRARNQVERTIDVLLIACSSIAILTTIGIVLSLIFESIRFFGKIPFFDFVFGVEWSPQTALRADQVGSTGVFGAIPLFAGTMLITLIAMLIAVPVGLLSAIYLSDYADLRVRGAVKPVVEILAGIPTVVYGFFAALTVAPLFRGIGESVGLDVASESALAAGTVMGIMIIPFISSLSDDVMNAVPQSLRNGSLAMGATKSETIRRVILPAALPGIFAACLLAVSRAIGETMIVVMAAGLAANLTANPFEAVTTVTVQIVTLLIGDQEFDSAKTLAAFALGLALFVITLAMNVVALHVVRKYREQYD
ncbi:MAG: phosphate ABC transporter permease subunit PstC [Defluviicoccus sp.]|nr:phosphate ABC transporter permease subunit PstC [Defluviicoccus sp.]MDE0386919.1 phosphate ABC transporter permease subunit PstC [Defluviicoccus sp.]